MRDSAQTAPPPSALQHTTEQAACHYASKRGFHCYPLKPGTRSAYLTFEKTGRKWGATSDPDMLVRMFRRFRDAELCIVTGELSGIFVLDVEVP
jgi:hypothetical protein